MADLKHRGPWYWQQVKLTAADTAGELAVLRRGIGRPAGSMPELWRFYTVTVPDAAAMRGQPTAELLAEHAALTLFAVHQQSIHSMLMHRPDVPLGLALRQLRDHKHTHEEAIDRRVVAAATASDVTELVAHLRGLITQLRGIEQPLDYTQLVSDLVDWQHPAARHRVRRRWGAAYYTWTRQPDKDAEDPDSTKADAAATANS